MPTLPCLILMPNVTSPGMCYIPWMEIILLLLLALFFMDVKAVGDFLRGVGATLGEIAQCLDESGE